LDIILFVILTLNTKLTIINNLFLYQQKKERNLGGGSKLKLFYFFPTQGCCEVYSILSNVIRILLVLLNLIWVVSGGRTYSNTTQNLYTIYYPDQQMHNIYIYIF